MPSLAELRAQSGPKPLPRGERTVTLIEGQHLLTEIQRLEEEKADLRQQAARFDESGERVGPPQKAGQGAGATERRNARLDEIDSAIGDIAGRLGEHQGIVGLTGISGGDWQRFKDDNPPREDDSADLRLTGGLCNSSALFSALGRFVTSWDGDMVTDGDWDSWLAERITYADRRDLVTAVVGLHETGMARAPKLPSSLSSTETSETA